MFLVLAHFTLYQLMLLLSTGPMAHSIINGFKLCSVTDREGAFGRTRLGAISSSNRVPGKRIGQLIRVRDARSHDARSGSFRCGPRQHWPRPFLHLCWYTRVRVIRLHCPARQQNLYKLDLTAVGVVQLETVSRCVVGPR